MSVIKQFILRLTTGWAKKLPPPPIILFILLLYLFTCTNNVPCDLEFCATYIEAQTKLICHQLVQKILQQT